MQTVLPDVVVKEVMLTVAVFIEHATLKVVTLVLTVNCDLVEVMSTISITEIREVIGNVQGVREKRMP